MDAGCLGIEQLGFPPRTDGGYDIGLWSTVGDYLLGIGPILQLIVLKKQGNELVLVKVFRNALARRPPPNCIVRISALSDPQNGLFNWAFKAADGKLSAVQAFVMGQFDSVSTLFHEPHRKIIYCQVPLKRFVSRASKEPDHLQVSLCPSCHLFQPKLCLRLFS